MRHFNAEYLVYGDETGNAEMVRDEYYDYDALPTHVRPQTQDDIDAAQADYYASAITQLAYERTEARRTALMAPVLHLREWDASKRMVARRCAKMVYDEIKRIEREIEEMTR